MHRDLPRQPQIMDPAVKVIPRRPQVAQFLRHQNLLRLGCRCHGCRFGRNGGAVKFLQLFLTCRNIQRQFVVKGEGFAVKDIQRLDIL